MDPEQAEWLAEQEEIYEELYPDAVAGVRRATGMHKALGHNVAEIISATFTDDTAAKVGKTPRSIQQDIQEAYRWTDKPLQPS